MTWVEANRDAALGERFIHELAHQPLAEIAERPWVVEPLRPLLECHRRNVELIARRARQEGDVVFFDLADEDLDGYNKFIVYDLFSAARYSVGVTRSKTRAKVSVGTNPWSPTPRTHNLAAICERYGGGGHPAVGAISVPPSRIDEARRIAAEIVEELRRG
jgi:hypothetical protein